MIATFLDWKNEQWKIFLKDNEHEFYQLPGYCELDKSLVNGALAKAFYYKEGDNEMLIPLVLKELPFNGTGDFKFDAKSPYGYSGILISSGFEVSKLNNILEIFTKTAAENGILTVFLRLNPLYNQFEITANKNFYLKIHGPTVVIDLSQQLEAIKSNYSSNHKRNIKSLNNKGYTTKINEWKYYKDFQSAYLATMSRVNSSTFYKFDVHYFETLREVLGENLFLCTVHDLIGNVACGGLFSYYNGLIEYHLGGTNESYLKDAPAKKMFSDTITMFKEMGGRLFHLGGGMATSEDSLFFFKKGFSNQLLEFRSLSMICDLENYELFNTFVLNKHNKEHYNCASDYIPLYRSI